MNVIENGDTDFRVISSTFQIAELFSMLYSKDKVILLPPLFISFRRPLRLLLDFVWFQSHKEKILSELKRLKPNRIIFTFTGRNGFESWLIKQIAPDTNVYYRPDKNRELYNKSNDLRTKIKCKLLGLAYNIPFAAIQNDGTPTIGISDRFLRAVNPKPFSDQIQPGSIGKFFYKHCPDLPSFRILLLVGNLYNVEDIEHFSKLQQVLETLFSICSPKEIAIKRHPTHILEGFTPPDGCTIIPDILPANLLCYKANIVIAYTSGALHEAANIGKTAIALLYLIESTDSLQAESKRKMFIANTHLDKRVLFPKTFDELKNMCLNALGSSE